MKKQYITKSYIEQLNDKEIKTGIYGTPPKVIIKGDKYREALSSNEKLVYMELFDMAKKAAHDNQVDEKGRVYVEVSYIFLAVGLGLSDSTIQRILSKITQPLFKLGLVSLKKRKDKSTSQYYVMAPMYEGDDELFLTNDGATPKMRKKAQELIAKKNRKTTSKREKENKELVEEKVFDTKADNAEYDFNEKKIKDDMPDFEDAEPSLPRFEPEPELEVENKEPAKKMYFRVNDRQDYDGTYTAHFVIEQNGKIADTWSINDFVKNTKSNIDMNRHLSCVMKDIEAEGHYEIRQS